MTKDQQRKAAEAQRKKALAMAEQRAIRQRAALRRTIQKREAKIRHEHQAALLAIAVAFANAIAMFG